jgi:hypothetical protein
MTAKRMQVRTMMAMAIIIIIGWMEGENLAWIVAGGSGDHD